MLARKYRLPIHRTHAFSKVISTPSFIMKTEKNNLGYSRFAFIISKKIDKRAVARNTIKRILVSAIQTIFPSLQKGYDILVIARKQIIVQTQASLTQEFSRIFKKEGQVL